MYSFPELIKKIREEASLTQSEFAQTLEVSTVLISMIETGQKEVSKNFILKLSEVMNVSPASITPFLFTDESNFNSKPSYIEKIFIDFGEKMQSHLIKNRAPLLKKYANK